VEDITELSNLRQQLDIKQKPIGLIGKDAKIVELREKIKSLAQVDVPVLIQGESGTGKELVAKAIHNHGPRSKKPFIAINCGAIPDNLLESEHENFIQYALVHCNGNSIQPEHLPPVVKTTKQYFAGDIENENLTRSLSAKRLLRQMVIKSKLHNSQAYPERPYIDF